jgi:hypothetical protein
LRLEATVGDDLARVAIRKGPGVRQGTACAFESATLLWALLIYFALKKAMGDCRRAEREDGLDLLG